MSLSSALGMEGKHSVQGVRWSEEKRTPKLSSSKMPLFGTDVGKSVPQGFVENNIDLGGKLGRYQ